MHAATSLSDSNSIPTATAKTVNRDNKHFERAIVIGERGASGGERKEGRREEAVRAARRRSNGDGKGRRSGPLEGIWWWLQRGKNKKKEYRAHRVTEAINVDKGDGAGRGVPPGAPYNEEDGWILPTTNINFLVLDSQETGACPSDHRVFSSIPVHNRVRRLVLSGCMLISCQEMHPAHLSLAVTARWG